MPSRASWTFSGSDAAATIRVWKAWLTGSEIAVKPASWNTLTAACTAGVSPPMTAWLLLLTLAMTTYPSEAPTIRSISGIGAMTAAIAPLSPRSTLAISRPRALTASRACSKFSTPAATSAPYSPRLWPITMSGAMP